MLNVTWNDQQHCASIAMAEGVKQELTQIYLHTCICENYIYLKR